MGTVATKIAEFKDKWDMLSLAFSPDGTRLAANTLVSDEVHVWAWEGRPHIVSTLHMQKGGQVDGLRYSPNGTLLAATHHPADEKEDRIIRVWNPNTGAIAADVSYAEGGLPLRGGIEFSPDSRYLMRSVGRWYTEDTTKVFVGNFIVQDTTTWQQAWVLKTKALYPGTFGVSGDGRYVALAGEERMERNGVPYLQPKILIVDLSERRTMRSFNVLDDDYEVMRVVWSPDRHRVAVGGRTGFLGPQRPAGLVEIFDVQTGTRLAQYTHGDTNNGLGYLPNSGCLIVGWGEVVEIWDAEHRTLLQEIPQKVGSLAISENGQYLAIAALDRAITVWRLK